MPECTTLKGVAGLIRALEWYAAPENWYEQADGRGRGTLRWRWADDDGHVARMALEEWRRANEDL